MQIIHGAGCQQLPPNPAEPGTHVQVLNGALAGGSVLCPEAQVGNHGQATVGDLVLLVLLVHGRVTAGETNGVEEPAACRHPQQATHQHCQCLGYNPAAALCSCWRTVGQQNEPFRCHGHLLLICQYSSASCTCAVAIVQLKHSPSGAPHPAQVPLPQAEVQLIPVRTTIDRLELT